MLMQESGLLIVSIIYVDGENSYENYEKYVELQGSQLNWNYYEKQHIKRFK